ncbi:beta-N-acetylhexosaminidase [Vibrio sp.]|uniref:beta-N-acetylhexosaminidase n=1 Tax=Vibrio sp. TaxID=678 RepID=UPI003D0AF59C
MLYRLDLAVVAENKAECRFSLTLHNLTDQRLTDWSLQFICDRFIQPDSVSDGELHQVGSLCTLRPEMTSLAANQHYYCEFSIKTAPLRFYSDGFKQAQICDLNGQPRFDVSLSAIALASPYRQRSQLPSIAASDCALIPKPNQIQFGNGEFHFHRRSQITLGCAQGESAALWLKQELNALYGMEFSAIGQSDIRFRSHPVLDPGGYQLEVSAEGVLISASSHSGFVHASASLIQLIRSQSAGQGYSVPYLTIKDQPRFGYRGMMLDSVRHFQPVEQIKRLINQLAHYKFNTFHWHLTDDEGWRIEIKAYPELTEQGAWRGPGELLQPQFSHLNQRYGGYYSQQEIREVIEFAEQRAIRVIPEIDIPGHCRAAIKALPELLADPGDQSHYRSVQNYTDNVLSPALPGTYQFIDRVLEEVAELFPSPWIHIGADEVPEGVWIDSPSCRQLMDQQGLQNAKELQGHLLRHAEQKLAALGKRMVGWEEAQHGNKVSRDTVIYSWLSEQAALQCAKQGFDVILQPGQFTYLDMAQNYAPEEPGVDWAGVIPLQQAYGYEPLADLADNDPSRRRILGIQCALWCEIVTDQPRMDYMIYPRLTALAEACWTEKPQRDWQDYLARLKSHLPLLDKQGIDYCPPWKTDGRP